MAGIQGRDSPKPIEGPSSGPPTPPGSPPPNAGTLQERLVTPTPSGKTVDSTSFSESLPPVKASRGTASLEDASNEQYFVDHDCIPLISPDEAPPQSAAITQPDDTEAVPAQTSDVTQPDDTTETPTKTEFQKISERFGLQSGQPSLFSTLTKMIKSVSIHKAFDGIKQIFHRHLTSAGKAEVRTLNETKERAKTNIKNMVEQYVNKGNIEGHDQKISSAINSYAALIDVIKNDIKTRYPSLKDPELDAFVQDVIENNLDQLAKSTELDKSCCNNLNKLISDREAIHIAQAIESDTLSDIINGPYPNFAIPSSILSRGTSDYARDYRTDLYNKSIVHALKLFAQTPEGRTKAADNFARAYQYADENTQKELNKLIDNELGRDNPLRKIIFAKVTYIGKINENLKEMDKFARENNRSIVSLLQHNFGDEMPPEVISYAFNAFVDGPIMDQMIETCAKARGGSSSFLSAHTTLMHQTEQLFPPGTLSENDYNTLSKRIADKLINFAEKTMKETGKAFEQKGLKKGGMTDVQGTHRKFASNVTPKTKNTIQNGINIDADPYKNAKDCANELKDMPEGEKRDAINALICGAVAAKRGNALQFLTVLRELSDDATKEMIIDKLKNLYTVGGVKNQFLSDFRENCAFFDSVREKLGEICTNFTDANTITDRLREALTSINESREKKIPESRFMQTVLILGDSIKNDPKIADKYRVIDRITERSIVARTVAKFREKSSFGFGTMRTKWKSQRQRFQNEFRTTSDANVSARRISQFCALYVQNGPSGERQERLEEMKDFLSDFLPRLSESDRAHFVRNMDQIKEISTDLNEFVENSTLLTTDYYLDKLGEDGKNTTLLKGALHNAVNNPHSSETEKKDKLLHIYDHLVTEGKSKDAKAFLQMIKDESERGATVLGIEVSDSFMNTNKAALEGAFYTIDAVTTQKVTIKDEPSSLQIQTRKDADKIVELYYKGKLLESRDKVAKKLDYLADRLPSSEREQYRSEVLMPKNLELENGFVKDPEGLNKQAKVIRKSISQTKGDDQKSDIARAHIKCLGRLYQTVREEEKTNIINEIVHVGETLVTNDRKIFLKVLNEESSSFPDGVASSVKADIEKKPELQSIGQRLSAAARNVFSRVPKARAKISNASTSVPAAGKRVAPAARRIFSNIHMPSPKAAMQRFTTYVQTAWIARGISSAKTPEGKTAAATKYLEALGPRSNKDANAARAEFIAVYNGLNAGDQQVLIDVLREEQHTIARDFFNSDIINYSFDHFEGFSTNDEYTHFEESPSLDSGQRLKKEQKHLSTETLRFAKTILTKDESPTDFTRQTIQCGDTEPFVPCDTIEGESRYNEVKTRLVEQGFNEDESAVALNLLRAGVYDDLNNFPSIMFRFKNDPASPVTTHGMREIGIQREVKKENDSLVITSRMGFVNAGDPDESNHIGKCYYAEKTIRIPLTIVSDIVDLENLTEDKIKNLSDQISVNTTITPFISKEDVIAMVKGQKEVSTMAKPTMVGEPRERQPFDELKDTLVEIANTNGKGRIKGGVLTCKHPKGKAAVQKGESAKSVKALEFALDQIEGRFQGDLSDDQKKELESILTSLLASDWAKSVFKNNEDLGNRRVALTRKLTESEGSTVKDNATLISNHLATSSSRAKLLTIYRWQMKSEEFFTELEKVKNDGNRDDVIALCQEWIENDTFNSGDVAKVEQQILSLCNNDDGISRLIADKKGSAQQSGSVPEGSEDLSVKLKEVGQGNRGTMVTDLARDLRFRSAHVFSQITMDDFAGQKWAKDKKWDTVGGKPVPPAGVRGCTEFFNNTASFVVDTILSEGEQIARTRQIEFFVDLADTCFEQGDYQSFMAIMAGLGDSSINRLKSSWLGAELKDTKAISDAHKKKMERCKKRAESMVEGVQLKNIRKAVDADKKAEKPYIPFLGMYLTDITFGDDKSPDEIKGEINQVKLDVLAGHQGEIVSAMSSLGKPKEGDLKYKLSSSLKAGSPEDNYNKSLQLEPRDEKQVFVRSKIDRFRKKNLIEDRLKNKIPNKWDADQIAYLISSDLLNDAQVEMLMEAMESPAAKEKLPVVMEAFNNRKKEGTAQDEARAPSPASSDEGEKE